MNFKLRSCGVKKLQIIRVNDVGEWSLIFCVGKMWVEITRGSPEHFSERNGYIHRLKLCGVRLLWPKRGV